MIKDGQWSGDGWFRRKKRGDGWLKMDNGAEKDDFVEKKGDGWLKMDNGEEKDDFVENKEKMGD